MFPGLGSTYEWPSDVQMFVTEARRILSYYQHLGEQQRPPKSIWHSTKKCEKWIKDHDPFKKDGDKSGGSALDINDWERE